MLKVFTSTPPSREDVLEFIKNLPENMVCTNRRIEFDPMWVSVTTIDAPPETGNLKPWRVELTFETDYSHPAA